MLLKAWKKTAPRCHFRGNLCAGVVKKLRVFVKGTELKPAHDACIIVSRSPRIQCPKTAQIRLLAHSVSRERWYLVGLKELEMDEGVWERPLNYVPQMWVMNESGDQSLPSRCGGRLCFASDLSEDKGSITAPCMPARASRGAHCQDRQARDDSIVTFPFYLLFYLVISVKKVSLLRMRAMKGGKCGGEGDLFFVWVKWLWIEINVASSLWLKSKWDWFEVLKCF